MLLTRATLEAIAGGTVTLAFRRWRRPTVRTGGTLTTAVGVLSIDDVSPIDLGDITESDARASGHADLKTLRGLLSKGAGRTVYRIALRRRGPDPCIALRAAVPSAADMDRIEARMARWDSASPSGPWTRKVLRLLTASARLLWKASHCFPRHWRAPGLERLLEAHPQPARRQKTSDIRRYGTAIRYAEIDRRPTESHETSHPEVA